MSHKRYFAFIRAIAPRMAAYTRLVRTWARPVPALRLARRRRATRARRKRAELPSLALEPEPFLAFLSADEESWSSSWNAYR